MVTEHTSRVLAGSALALLVGLWERGLHLGAAYDYRTARSPYALAECDWGNIIVATALLLPLCTVTLLGRRLATSGVRLISWLLALAVVPPLALALFLLLAPHGYVD